VNKKASENSPSDLVSEDLRCVWHPYTQMLTAPPPIPVERAEGVYLYKADGKRILDGISSWWVNIHGHNHPRLNKALAEQASKFSHVMFGGFTHRPAVQLAAELIDRSPSNLARVFFSDNGSTAIEIALKMSFHYWRNRGEPERDLFLALEHAYHGDTFGAMSVGGVKAFHSNYDRLLFEVRRAHTPYCFSCPVGQVRNRCRIECAQQLEQILEEEGTRLAAVILEPMVQGAGGMIVWPPEFLLRVREATRRHSIPLIADEIFTGFGRTGKMFACEHGPIEPDILCLSKALTGGYLPLAATITSDEIYRTFLSPQRDRTFFHGHSYTGNALACAVALESLALFDDENRLRRVGELECLFRERLQRLRGLPEVGDVRGIGALAVVELVPEKKAGYLDERGPRLAESFLARGLLLRPLGNVLYFLPPYVITDEQAHWAFDVIEEVIGGTGTES